MTTSISAPLLKSSEKEFFRLMGFPLPFEELSAHYMDMLLEYDSDLPKQAEQFNSYVDWCQKSGYEKPSSYRIDHAMEWFIKWAKERNPMAVELPDPLLSMPKADLRKGMNGRMLLSLDITSANYSVMRWMAIRNDIDVPESWASLCEQLGIHPFLASRKIFRQYCFGNYMPSRYASLQKHVMALLYKELALTREQLVLSSHDEIVIEYPQEEGYSNFMLRVKKAMDDVGLGELIAIKGTIYKTLAIRDALLSMVVNDGANMGELLARYGQERGDTCLRIEYGIGSMGTEFYEKKKLLVGVSKNKFYAYLRAVVLEEQLEDNDLIFENEGMAAKWLLGNAKKWALNSGTQLRLR